MKVSKGQSQPEIVAAAFLLLYMVLGIDHLYQVLMVTHLGIIWVWVKIKPRFWSMLSLFSVHFGVTLFLTHSHLGMKPNHKPFDLAHDLISLGKKPFCMVFGP